MVTQRKRSPDPKYFSFGQWPKVTRVCLFDYSRALLGDKKPNPIAHWSRLSKPSEEAGVQEASRSLGGSSWVPAPPHPRDNSCPLSCGVSSVCPPAPQAPSEADSQRTDILRRPASTRNGLRVRLRVRPSGAPSTPGQLPLQHPTVAP